MPPKKKQEVDDEDDEGDTTESTESSEDSTESSSEEDSPKKPPPKAVSKAPAPAPVAAPTSQRPPAAAPATSSVVANQPFDEAFDVGDDERVATPPRANRTGDIPRPTAASGGSRGQQIHNAPHDETVEFDDDDRAHMRTPPDNKRQAPQKSAPTGGPTVGTSGPIKANKISNDRHDEAFEVDDGHAVTPPGTRQGKQATGGPSSRPAGGPATQALHNLPHDEVMEDYDDEGHRRTPEELKSSPQTGGAVSGNSGKPQPKQTAVGGRPAPKKGRDNESSSSSSDDEKPAPTQMAGGASGRQNMISAMTPQSQGTSGAPAAGGTSPTYNPKDYANLNVSREVKDLFMCITQFQPTNVELSAKLIPFIPDYIPAVGDIDAFCKVPRPDNKPDTLGLTVVDEPCANQSNPAVVNIALSYQIKQQARPVFVDSVEDAHNRPQVIDRWIEDIRALHAKNPPPTVNYSKPMPDVERLLQIWPQEMEDLLGEGAILPPAHLDVDLIQFVKILCVLLDIPTHGNLVESLHVMFTLFMEFKSNQHFQHAATRLLP